jgi:hypothetical protein
MSNPQGGFDQISAPELIDAPRQCHVTTRGFVLGGGRFTSLTYPNATFTAAFKINLPGQIVGQYKTSDGKTYGFLLSGGTYTAINYPNATYTSANGINDLGKFVGRWDDSAGHTGKSARAARPAARAGCSSRATPGCGRSW